MYREYWKLRELPFDNTPNTKYFFSSEKHQEALSRLQYLVREKRPGGLLTGVFGCGKTLVLQALKNTTVPEGYKYSVVTNPRLNDVGLLRRTASTRSSSLTRRTPSRSRRFSRSFAFS